MATVATVNPNELDMNSAMLDLNFIGCFILLEADVYDHMELSEPTRMAIRVRKSFV